MRLSAPALALLLWAGPLGGQLREVETSNLRLLFYDERHTYLAPQLMRAFENAMEFHKKLFKYQPSGKVTVLLEDFSDFSSGGADVLPTNQINISISPADYTYETAPSSERMSWLMNHELTHIVDMDGALPSARFFRGVFGPGPLTGKVMPRAEDPLSMAYGYLTVPRRYAPRWYHEGLAVFLETWMSGGIGRALGGYDEMVFRAMVRDESRIYDVVGLDVEGTTSDFQVGMNSYLYGTRFMTWLAAQYGAQKVIEWGGSGEGSKAYFASQFRKVFGQSLQRAWSQWIDAEHEWQNQNLAAIRKYPLTALKRISPLALGSVSNSFYDDSADRIYAAVRYPGPMAHLAAIDPETGESKRLHNIEGPALMFVSSVSFDRDARKLFFTTHNNELRDLNVYDLTTGKSTELIKNFRGGDLAFDSKTRSLCGVRHANGLSTLIETAPPYRQMVERLSLPYGSDVFDLDISPDGESMCAIAADTSGRQKLVRFSMERLRVGENAMETLHDFQFSTAGSFRFSPDGRMLYGTSYFTGASNIFRFDTQTSAMDILTNAETGLFRPQMLNDGRLIAYEYTAKGFVAVVVEEPKPLSDVNAVTYFGQQVVERSPVVRDWKLPPQPDIDLTQLTVRAGTYTPLRRVEPASLYPIVQGYKGAAAYGGRMDFFEGLGLASISLTAAYSPGASLESKERIHLGLNIRSWGWHITANYNKADFYDLFGPTKVSLKGFEGEIGHKKHLRRRGPRTLDLEWAIAGYAGLDRIPEYQNVSAPVDKLFSGRVGLSYSRLERSLGAVDDEQGIRWKVIGQGYAAAGDFYPRFYGTFDYGILTPIRNSSVWIRSSAGKSVGDRKQPFANFYFGGFGNNYIDRLEVSRYREYYSFAGVKLNHIGASNFAKTQIEWNLPPLRFRRFGTPWIYCNWARLSLFSGVIGGNLAAASDRLAYVNVGSQLDFKVVLSSYLNTTFSIGSALARDRRGQSTSELMFSLKLL